MDLNIIRDALNGQIKWFDPTKELTEAEFRKNIKDSVRRSKHQNRCLRSIEELVELELALIKLERSEGDKVWKPDEWLNIHEEIGDALWAIGYIIERYGLSEDMVKSIHKFKIELNLREDASEGS